MRELDKRGFEEIPQAERESDPRFRTANGVQITDGLRVWDYDLKSGSVDFAETARFGRSYWDGWFRVRVDGAERTSMMNGERITTRHPFTRDAPPPAPERDTGTGER